MRRLIIVAMLLATHSSLYAQVRERAERGNRPDRPERRQPAENAREPKEPVANAAEANDADANNAAEADPVAEQRAWLRKLLIDPIRSGRKRDLYNARLNRMDAAQVAQLANYYRNLAEQRRRAQQGFNNRGAVGYRPVITWLPSGTNLGVGAVVSPDRRSVRTSINPVFSSVPYYDTFNMRNGNTRRYYINPPQPRVGSPRTPAAPSRATPSWYRRVRGR